MTWRIGRRVERDVVGIALHEADLLRVHADLRLVAGHERTAAARAGRPEQDLVALEMSSGADQRQAAEQRLALALPEADARVRAHHPGPLGLVDVNRCVAEGATPLDHRRVIVRVRDRDLGDPAQLA